MEVGNKYVVPDKEPASDTVCKTQMFRFEILFSLQPFRNSSLLRAEPKSIHDAQEVGNKYVVPDKESDDTVSQRYIENVGASVSKNIMTQFQNYFLLG